jgi:hypothetical protein
VWSAHAFGNMILNVIDCVCLLLKLTLTMAVKRFNLQFLEIQLENCIERLTVLIIIKNVKGHFIGSYREIY